MWLLPCWCVNHSTLQIPQDDGRTSQGGEESVFDFTIINLLFMSCILRVKLVILWLYINFKVTRLWIPSVSCNMAYICSYELLDRSLPELDSLLDSTLLYIEQGWLGKTFPVFPWKETNKKSITVGKFRENTYMTSWCKSNNKMPRAFKICQEFIWYFLYL